MLWRLPDRALAEYEHVLGHKIARMFQGGWHAEARAAIAVHEWVMDELHRRATSELKWPGQAGYARSGHAGKRKRPTRETFERS